MNQLLKKILLPISLTGTVVCLTGLQRSEAQSSSAKDSVRHLLTWFDKHAKDETLKQAIKVAQTACNANPINDSAAQQLLTVDSILLTALQPDQQQIAFYAEGLARCYKCTTSTERNLQTSLRLGRLCAGGVKIKVPIFSFISTYLNVLTRLSFRLNPEELVAFCVRDN